MKSNREIQIEQAKLQERYSNYFEQYEESEDNATYWSFFKLRILFSIIMVLIVFASNQTLSSTQAKKVQGVVQSMKEEDPYTQIMIKKLADFQPK